MRSEADVRAQTYATSLAAGWISINEVRALEGLAPVNGGEVPRLQKQYRPIDEEPEPAPAPADPAAPTEPDQEEPATTPTGAPAPEPNKGLRDAGVWSADARYMLGDVVTKDDGLWCCSAETEEEPGTTASWRLMLQRGKRGLRGKDHTEEIAELRAIIAVLQEKLNDH